MNFWFSLSTDTITSKVSVDAWKKVKRISATGFKISDVLSAMIMMADEDELTKKLSDHISEVSQLPKSVQALLKDQDKLTPEARKLITDALGE